MVIVVKNLPANAGDTGNADSIPGSERSPGGGRGNPLQSSGLENSMEREAWRATVHRVAKSQTRLSNLAQHARKHKGQSHTACTSDPDVIWCYFLPQRYKQSWPRSLWTPLWFFKSLKLCWLGEKKSATWELKVKLCAVLSRFSYVQLFASFMKVTARFMRVAARFMKVTESHKEQMSPRRILVFF